MDEAYAHMELYVPLRDEWTPHDKVVFERQYAIHSKNFAKILQVVSSAVFSIFEVKVESLDNRFALRFALRGV